jgi:5-methylcytosine-specific restriction protein A
VNAFEAVFTGYEAASMDAGGLARRRVSGQPQSDAERAIRIELPALLLSEIERSGRDPSDYRVKATVGQNNFPFARIPWVAALRREITTSTERGYYIVLLFREDMSGCALSLNQGYTEFKNAFGTDTLAAAKILESAAVAGSYLDLPANCIAGPIDLAATGNLGVGYERGAIASFVYDASEDTPQSQFLADFTDLLTAYDVLRQKIGLRIADAASPPTEDDFQEAASALSKPAKKNPYVPPPPGPVPPPEKAPNSKGSAFKRDPKVSGAAISNAGYLCEVDASHLSFVSRTTKKNFVEAHHLVPLQFQDQFTVGLDVVENVIAVCPVCHRKLHHGRMNEKRVVLEQLLNARAESLESRGIVVASEKLFSLYSTKFEEE